eukprot:CAMPEP_0198132382 /NCGR_PEP_ID=MMETSP1442-20131203/58226_1 /TAXON_ID= /ORGANISM="Craspedostauros australis, Strain CCMP3328" /LENGTH=57 /DNA_ID=CAMNT_0043793375 /DNA_START=30 /DNA_END=199 /DNA_ORIENTATION=+
MECRASDQGTQAEHQLLPAMASEDMEGLDPRRLVPSAGLHEDLAVADAIRVRILRDR